MSGESFDQMSGLTFANAGGTLNGTEVEDRTSPRAESKPIPEVEAAFSSDPKVRALCPICQTIGEGTFEQLQLHMQECRVAPD